MEQETREKQRHPLRFVRRVVGVESRLQGSGELAAALPEGYTLAVTRKEG